MYIIYIDESGDTGLAGSPTNFFALSGLVVHELRWKSLLDSIITFRRDLRKRYGLKVREEIHASQLIRGNGKCSRIKKSLRLQILKDVLEFQAKNTDLSVINVVVDKTNKPPNYDVFEQAWLTLLQRFSNTVQRNNFPGPKNQFDCGIVVADNTDVGKLRSLLRKAQVFNPIPNTGGVGFRMLPMQNLVKDPIFRDSAGSYFIQLADVNAYFLTQRLKPCGYVKTKGAKNYFDKLNPILCKVASRTDPMGIVKL